MQKLAFSWLTLFCLTGVLEARVCFVISDPRDCTESEEICSRESDCPWCESDTATMPEELEPTWPTKMDAPFQDEISR